MPQGAPGKLGFDLVEGQRRTALSVTNLESVEFECRPQPGPMRLNLAYAYGAIDRGADQLLDIAAVTLDLRQDRIAQGQQQQGEGEVA